jgi:aspartyl-tRNA(Asn)/glutamyl-tRNA(Gln) amidotransferase subunit C
MAHPLPINSVFRADETNESVGVDKALANAPKRDTEFYLVPPVLE